jgi:sialic acid synthase
MLFNYDYQKPKIIAEIGCNHMGEIGIAKELIVLAKECGADVAKFQTRDNKLLLTEEQYKTPHLNQDNSYGNTYGEHREYLEFTQDQHCELKNYCENVGIHYSTSVWEINSAKMIFELKPSFIKVPSACNNNFEMLKLLRDEYQGEVQISFGMTTKAEAEEVIKFFEVNDNAKDRLIIYACTSGYPVPFKDVALLEINNLYEKYGDRVKEIGFSGHHLGIAVDNAAYTLGARWIERHFTKDRTWKGTDHAASLEPDGLRKLVRNLNACYAALSHKGRDILEIEQVQRNKLKNKK